MEKIPVIDLFAGPGGLGEGFSSVYNEENQKKTFDIKLSIEKDEHAHKTLELRSFYRQFDEGQVPAEYYDFLKETNLSKQKQLRKKLFEKYNEQGNHAKREAWHVELGEVNEDTLDKRIKENLRGEKNWVLIGGPPCQAYSVVGRSRVNGIDKDDKRVYLYKEYLRIIAEHQPAVFVMENVRGLLSAKVNGESMFQKILEDLQSPTRVFKNTKSKDYHIYSLVKKPNKPDIWGNLEYENDKDYLIKSEEYGIPQKRHRVILLGIRKDIKVIPDVLQPTKEPTTLSDVISDLPKLRSGISRKEDDSKVSIDGKIKPKYKTIEDDETTWRKIVVQYNKELKSDKLKAFRQMKFENDRGAEFIPYDTSIKTLKSWYKDERLKGVCNHSTRAHLSSDLKRYLFAALFLEEKKVFPRMKDYPEDLLPAHKNVTSGKFADRFRVQYPNQPATTITSHISKDGHYFIHYDPLQCRSMTVREAARVQTFPDNYYFCGSRTAQYQQVGNAVPPLLAKQIGEIVYKIIKQL